MAWRRSKKKREAAKDADLAEVEGKAVELLARRDHGVEELRRKLRERGYPAEMIDEAVARCEELNYLDDDRIAGRWVDQLVDQQWGPRQIQAKLRGRGLDDGLIDRELERHDEATWVEHADARLRSKFGAPDELEEDDRQKAYRHLSYRGYHGGTVRRVIFADDD